MWWWKNADGMTLRVDGRMITTTEVLGEEIASDVLVHGQVVTNPDNGRIYDGPYDFKPVNMNNPNNSPLTYLWNSVNLHLRERHGTGQTVSN